MHMDPLDWDKKRLAKFIIIFFLILYCNRIGKIAFVKKKEKGIHLVRSFLHSM